MSDFIIMERDLSNLDQVISKEMPMLQNNLSFCRKRIKSFSGNKFFKGATAKSVKRYMSEVHGLMLSSLGQIAYLFETQAGSYVAKARSLDRQRNYVLPQNTICHYSDKLAETTDKTIQCTDDINKALDRVADIIGRNHVDSSYVRSISNQMIHTSNQLCRDVQRTEAAAVASLGELEHYMNLLENCINELNDTGQLDMFHYGNGYISEPRKYGYIDTLYQRFMTEHIYISLVQNIEGKIIIDIDLLKEFIVRPIHRIRPYEQAAVLKTLFKIRQTADFYEELSRTGVTRAGNSRLSYVAWMIIDPHFHNFTSVSKYYRNLFSEMLLFIDQKKNIHPTFASDLATAGIPDSVSSLIGTDAENSLKGIFGENRLAAFISRHNEEYGEQYFAVLEANEQSALAPEN